MAFFLLTSQILRNDRKKYVMLNAEPRELENIYRSAVESAALLRRCGETAKAVRVESLARIVARELERRGVSPASDHRQVWHGPLACT